MKKKLFQRPEMTVIFIESADIVCTSDGNSVDNMLTEQDKII